MAFGDLCLSGEGIGSPTSVRPAESPRVVERARERERGEWKTRRGCALDLQEE